MSYAASLENCKRLYELSGWRNDLPTIPGSDTPAYDLGYLIRKLPAVIVDSHGTHFALMGFPGSITPWFAYKSALTGPEARWPNDQGIPYYKRVFEAGTPEDAACLVAIKLIEQGILKP